MLVVGIVMSHIQMAIDTLEIEFLGILLIIEMGRYAIVGEVLWEKVLMTFHTRLVIYNLLSILQLLLACKVYFPGVLGEIGPHVLHTRFGLSQEMAGCALGGQVTCATVGDHTALVVVVDRLLPAVLGMRMDVALHACLVFRTFIN